MDFVKQLEKLQKDLNNKLNELPEDKRAEIMSQVDINKEFNKSIKKINKAKNDYITKSK